jgi:hypothetical protein
MTKDEALKMAIDEARIGLGKVRQYLGWQEPIEDELCLEILKAWKTLDACKEALAEAEKQEPVKLQFPVMLRKMWSGGEVQEWLDKQQPLYTHPATWQSLSDDEIQSILDNSVYCEVDAEPFARAVEQALKEKNHG